MTDNAAKFDIIIHANADYIMTLTVTDSDGNIMNLTGYTITAQLREFPEAHDYFEFTTTHNGSGGQILMVMPHERTEKIPFTQGVYDVFAEDGNNTIEKYMYGDVVIVPSVTHD